MRNLDTYIYHTYNTNMNEISFEWDDTKAQKNIKKHGVSFEEACTVFYDDQAILFDDPEHSHDEERFNLLGISEETNMLIVCHCVRGVDDEIIRIISARKATKTETDYYNSNNLVGE